MKLTKDEMLPRARLMALAKQKRVSLASLSELIGRNSSYLQQFMGRGSPRKLEERDRKVLAEFFGISESELGGPEDNSSRAGRVSGPTPKARADWVVIPRLPLDASAGPGSNGGGASGAEEISYDHFRFTRRWLREMGLEGADLSAIRVEGDSMEPVLRSGDEIFVDQNKRAGDGIHVVRVGDSLHVKQVQTLGPGRIKLVSANEAYPPISLDQSEVEIIGRVVWKGGRV